MRRIILILLFILSAQAFSLSGCAKNAEKIQTENKFSIVCTIFPLYDWTRQIIGDNAENMDLTLLMDNGADLHNYQLSVGDIVKISNCDVFVYVGGESDEWAGDILNQAANKNMVVLNLMEALGDRLKTEEIKEGMENPGEPGGDDYDEHIWLSLKNARILCSAIAGALSSLDAGGAEKYRANLAGYDKKLSELDLKYHAAIDSAPVRTLLFGDRFPFRYLTDDYGLDYYAAFAGCSAESEASFKTVISLAEKTDELALKNIMVTESSDKKIAETIIRESKEKKQRILVLDAMQSLSANDAANGAAYLSIMESNLEILKEALR